MSYDLYITRKTTPYDVDGPEISEADWRGLIAELGCFKPIKSVAVGDATLNIPQEWHPHFWTGHPDSTDVVGPIFQLMDGNLSVKYVDQETARFALDLAEKLGARLIGEAGEVYTREQLAPYKGPIPKFLAKLLKLN